MWLAAGVTFGLALSWMWPHQPAGAGVVDRDAKFGMITVPVKDVQFGGVRDNLEGVFVLDFLTGQITGGVLSSKTGTFLHGYAYNVAADFQIDPNKQPNYAIVTGNTGLVSRGRVTMATGVIYVGELNSGLVIAYGFPYNDTNRPVALSLVKVDKFQWRQPSE